MPNIPRTWIELSASAFRHNLSIWQSLVGRRKIMPIIKANAYGHGLDEILQLLRGTSIWGVGVAYDDEALRVRSSYRGRVLVLSYWQPRALPKIISNGIEFAITNRVAWESARPALRRYPTGRYHIKIDTGTSRLGFLPSELRSLSGKTKEPSFVGVFSHLANAEESSAQRTRNQIKRFTTLSNYWDLNGVERHLACTAAIIRYPEAYFDVLRLGIGLYGLWPSKEIRTWSRRNRPKFHLKPVLSWHTKLAQIKNVPAGTGIGYGWSKKVRINTRIGTIPVGYADGYDRRLSNVGQVLIHGRAAPIIGRISMNVAMVNLQAHPQAKVGDRVTLVGSGLQLDDLAGKAGILNYEFVSRLNPDILRRIV